jgi:hypothetical protein
MYHRKGDTVKYMTYNQDDEALSPAKCTKGPTRKIIKHIGKIK